MHELMLGERLTLLLAQQKWSVRASLACILIRGFQMTKTVPLRNLEYLGGGELVYPRENRVE